MFIGHKCQTCNHLVMYHLASKWETKNPEKPIQVMECSAGLCKIGPRGIHEMIIGPSIILPSFNPFTGKRLSRIAMPGSFLNREASRQRIRVCDCYRCFDLYEDLTKPKRRPVVDVPGGNLL